MHNAKDIIKIFDHCFEQEFNTVLLGDAEEPVYLPADTKNTFNRVFFAHDYYASALHEVAHWCVAGAQRRTEVDYGYWYEPDGRSESQQAEFEKVEVTPQAIEWLFTQAVGGKFRVSADNLASNEGPSPSFKLKIALKAQKYCAEGVSQRALRFISALQVFYKTDDILNPRHYSYKAL